MDDPEQKHQSLSQRWRKTTISNQIMVIATVFIAVATACNVGVAALQWHEMARTSRDTQDILRASNRQAAAAETANEVGRQSAEATNRLTEGMNAASIMLGEIPWGPSPGSFQLANMGKVAAKNVSLIVTYEWVDLRKETVTSRKIKQFQFPSIAALYAQTQSFPTEFMSLQDMYGSQQTVFFSMKATYENGFGTTVHTSSCKGYVVSGEPPSIGGTNADCDALIERPGYSKFARELLKGLR